MGLGADSVIGVKGATERARAARLKLMEGNESLRVAHPQPISTVQQQDAYSDCTMIRAEINANNQKAQQLATNRA